MAEKKKKGAPPNWNYRILAVTVFVGVVTLLCYGFMIVLGLLFTR